MGPAQRITASAVTLGEGMPIRRALPTVRRRLIGAWCFLDHFGPSDISAGKGMRVGPHPHIGLQTVTWLLRGEVLHRDSLGNVQVITPGALNLMTAGRGISHSEESPTPHSPEIHGLQLWIALPDAKRAIEPDFAHYPSVPVVNQDGCAISVFVGEWLGERSPAAVHSPLVGACIEAEASAATRLPLRADFEHGVVVTHGEVEVNGERLSPGTLLYLPLGTPELALSNGNDNAGVALVGGAPLGEEILMWWNFVAREKQEVVQVTRDWNNGTGYLGDVRGYDGARLVAPMPPWGDVPLEVVKYP